MDRNAVAAFYFLDKSHHIPIGEANAAVTRSLTNRIGLVSAVDANALLVQRDPHYGYRITGNPAGGGKSVGLGKQNAPFLFANKEEEKGAMETSELRY
jgi:hypothetical protein